MQTTFDASKYKQTTLAQWQEAAQAWSEWGPLLRRWLGPATELMLDLSGVREGSRVLDVAAGAGDQSIQAAERVGPNGHVLATDISPRILEHAAVNARNAGVRIETAALDGENLEVPRESFDAAISRLGLMYFPDLPRALGQMRAALKPGGRVGAIVFSTPDKNGFFSTPVSIVRRRAGLPAPTPGQPGPFSLGPAGVLESTFTQAGFSQVVVRAVSAPLRMASADECLRFEQESFGALHQMLSGLPAPEQTAAWDEIRSALKELERDGAFVGPCELLVAAATR